MPGEAKIKLFDVQVEEIERSNPYTFPLLMKKILRSELTMLKLKQSSLVLSLDITDPDGGLDAYLGSEIPADHPWLPKGKSGWQFKAVNNFSVAETKNEVLNDQKNALKPRIDKLLKENATYVLAISGKDYVPTDLEERENALKRVFKENGYPDAKVKIYSSGQIADWASTLPSVVAHLKHDRINFKDFMQWQNIIDLQEEFVPDAERNRLITSFRKHIIENQSSNRSTIIRLVGLSGVGKTRLAYECLNDDNLRDMVLYLESPDKLPSAKFNEFAQNAEIRAILVIDDCSNLDFVRLAKEADFIGGRFTFITLDYDIDKPRDANDIHQELFPLDNAASEILVKKVAPDLPDNARKKIIDFSEGFPIILKKLSENFVSHADILSASTLNALGINSVLDRIIEGRGAGSYPINEIRRVLTRLSLFKRIGWDDELSVQGQRLCEIEGITWSEARMVVEEQENRKLIVRGGRYRYVTPLPLAINLSSTWLHAMDDKNIRAFYDKLGSEMQEAFLARLADLGYTEYAKEKLRGFLSQYNYETLNTSTGSGIFLYLSKADHSFSMNMLNKILASCSKEQLLAFSAGRRNIVWVLEKNAWWEDTFSSAASLLLKLADAENESWSNNATGAFIALFQTYLGGTEVPVWERFSVLKDALLSGNKDTQKIAIKAIGSSLNLTHAFRTSNSEEQGFIIPPPEWMPKTSVDLERAVTGAFSLVNIAQNSPDKEIQLIASRLILSHARELISVGFLDLVLKELSFIQNNYSELAPEVIGAVEQILYYDGKMIPPPVRETIAEFRESLIGDSFHGLMIRYVMTEIIEDHFEEQRQIVLDKIKELASIAISSPEQLEKELNPLVASRAENAYLFGNMLGELDRHNKWLKRISNLITTTANGSTLFFSGYLSALKVRDEALYRRSITQWMDKIAPTTILEIIWRSGATDWDARLIIKTLTEKKINPLQIRMFLYGAWFKHIDIRIFTELLQEFSKSADEKSALAIIGIIDQYVEEHEEILAEKDLIIKILDKASLQKDDMDSYYWNKLLQALTNKYKDTVPAFVDLTLNRLRENLTFESEAEETLRQYLEKNPEGTWSKIKEKLNAETPDSWQLVELIKGQLNFGNKKSLFSLIPEKELWAWVDKNPAKAPYMLARMIPLRELEPKLHPIARKLIMKFPGNEKIKDALLSNWYTEIFSGKASEHYKHKLKVLQEWQKDPEKVISTWAKAGESRLKQVIKREEIGEVEDELV